MYQGALTEGFAGAISPAQEALRSDRLLNYVWINADHPSVRRPSKHQCSIPLTYLDRAYANARRYPDTEVRIWYDAEFIDEQSLYFLQSHIYISAPKNVRLKNLRDIEIYRSAYGFQRHDYARVFERADIARFMAIAEGFKTTKADNIFYADFDVDDVQLDNRRTHDVLDNYGICLGRITDCDNHALKERLDNDFAHGYIAVNRSQYRYLDKVLIPRLDAAMKEGARICTEIRFSLFLKFGDNFSRCLESVVADLATNIPIPPIKAVMPPNHEWYDHETFCPYFAGREPPPL